MLTQKVNVVDLSSLSSNPRSFLLSGQSSLVVGRCDKFDCYYDCRLALAGGGECGRAAQCECYQRDGVQRGADNIWYELSRRQQQHITDTEEDSHHTDLGSGGGEEEDNYYDQEDDDDDDDDGGGDDDGESWWSG